MLLVRHSKFKLVVVVGVFATYLIAQSVLQIDGVKVLVARIKQSVSKSVDSFITNFKDPEKLINIGSLVRDREDTEKWDREVALAIHENGPIDQVKILRKEGKVTEID